MLTRRSLMIAGLTVPAAVIGARAALALTPQQEVLDKSRISFDKLITSVEFGELPGYMKQSKAVLIFRRAAPTVGASRPSMTWLPAASACRSAAKSAKSC